METKKFSHKQYSFLFVLLSFFVSSAFVASAASAGTLSFVSVDKVVPWDKMVNINSASPQELSDKLKGIGTKKAALIVDYRSKHGPFSSVDELLNVKGIGPKILSKNKHKIQL